MKNNLLAKLIGILGFSTVATSCELIEEIGGGGQVCMYGVPSANYVFNADVVDKDTDQPIEGIRVSAIIERQYWDSSTNMADYQIDTLAKGLTGADGKVVLEFSAFPEKKHTIAFDDIDGSENGGKYASVAVDVKSEGDDYEDSVDMWNQGTATHDVSVKLTKIEEEE